MQNKTINKIQTLIFISLKSLSLYCFIKEDYFLDIVQLK